MVEQLERKAMIFFNMVYLYFIFTVIWDDGMMMKEKGEKQPQYSNP